MDRSLRRDLAEALGADAVLQSGELLAPAMVEGVGMALLLAHQHRFAVRVTSGDGSRSTPPDGGVILSLVRLAAVSVDPAKGIARAEAGATLESLRTALAAHNLTVPGLPSQPRSRHAGSLVARGEVPRRSLTGVDAVLPEGELVRLGAAVLKDVVGYDLTSALLGSEGRLAVITTLHLRLAPVGARLPTPDATGPRSVAELAPVLDPEGILAGA